MNKDNEIMVSVYMLSYNHANYLRRAIEGVLNQKTTFKVQFIIHDDFSPDDSQKIIQEYVERYPGRITTVYQTENQYSKKVHILENYIYPLIKGKYIIACEGDDFWCDTNKLQKQVDFLEEHPNYVACTHNCFFIDQSDRIKWIDSRCTICKEHSYTVRMNYLGAYYPGSTAAIMYKASVIFDMSEEEHAEYVKITTQGDMKRNFLLSINGGIYYFDDIMSAYRRVVIPGGTSWSSMNANINQEDRRFISSIQMRKYAKKYKHCAYRNYYKTFNAACRAILKTVRNNTEENRIVLNKIYEFMGGTVKFYLYFILLAFIAVPLYFERNSAADRMIDYEKIQYIKSIEGLLFDEIR